MVNKLRSNVVTLCSYPCCHLNQTIVNQKKIDQDNYTRKDNVHMKRPLTTRLLTVACSVAS
jgi:hypothetical protein